MRSGASRDAFPSGAWERHRRGGLFHMLGSGQTRMPPQERRHEEVFVWGIFLRLDWEPLREHVLAGGPASHACRRGSGSTRGFWFCGGALLPFVLRACCGSRNAKRSFAGRIPKRSLGTTQRGRGAVAVWTEGGCGGEGLTTGVVRHACRLRRDGTRRFLFGGFFCGWTGSRCGSMCWPVDRPATHAAAGAAARGFFVFVGGALLPFVLGLVAGARMRSGASRDAFPSGAWGLFHTLVAASSLLAGRKAAGVLSPSGNVKWRHPSNSTNCRSSPLPLSQARRQRGQAAA